MFRLLLGISIVTIIRFITIGITIIIIIIIIKHSIYHYYQNSNIIVNYYQIIKFVIIIKFGNVVFISIIKLSLLSNIVFIIIIVNKYR